MAKIKYLDDYVDYMCELYPEIDVEAVKEMMKDSLDTLRKMGSSNRKVRIYKKGSDLFGEGFTGNLKIGNIHTAGHAYKMNNVFSRKREEKKEADGKSNNK